jgi:predicted dehydrogenase
MNQVQEPTVPNQLGLAVVGCGYWGMNYLRVFSELPSARVVVACDSRPERLKEVAERFPRLPLTMDYEKALNSPGVDAVVIATPASAHYPLARTSLMSGKHVLVEKPITKTVAEAEDLCVFAESLRLTLMVGHTFLFNPAVRKIKEYLQQDKAGRVYYVYARHTNMGPIRADVNAVWDLAPHPLSIFNYLLEDTPVWVSAVGAKVLRNGREDVGFVSIGYHSDIVGHIHASWADAYKVREVVVVGSEARIVFNDVNPMWRLQVFEKGVSVREPEPATFGEYQLRISDGEIINPRIEASEPLKNQCIHFLECVERGVPPLSDGWFARDVVQAMEAIDRSIQSKGAPEEVVRENFYARTPAHASPLR